MAIMSLKLQAAVSHLKAGGVIAYPTETVWGFGCDPQNPRAVARLLAMKQRSMDKGLILVAASAEQFRPYLEGLTAAALAKFCGPTARPTTWLVPDNNSAPPWISGAFNSVALRVSAHQQVADLCEAFGGAIVSSSANRTGAVTASWPWQLQRFLGRGLDYILPGDLGDAGQPSVIRDVISDEIIRP